MTSCTVQRDLVLAIVLLLPLLKYLWGRSSGESLGAWIARTELALTATLEARLQHSLWLTPGTYLRQLLWAVYVSYPMPWLYALASFLGMFQNDLDCGLGTFLSIWLEATVLIACLGFVNLCGLRNRPAALDWRRFWLGLPQILFYSLIFLNVYGLLTANIAFDGFKDLIWQHDSNKAEARTQLFFLLVVVLPFWLYIESRRPGEFLFDCLSRLHEQSKQGIQARFQQTLLMTPLDCLAYLKHIGLATYPWWFLVTLLLLGADPLGLEFKYKWTQPGAFPAFLWGWVVGLLVFSLLLLPYYTSANVKHGLSVGITTILLWFQLLLYGIALVSLATQMRNSQKQELSPEQAWAHFLKTGEVPSSRREQPPTPAPDPEGLARRYAGRVIEPELVSIPAGEYLHGCAEEAAKDCEDDDSLTLRMNLRACQAAGELDCNQRHADEPRQQRAAVTKFFMGKYEVTFDEWDACVAAKACQHWPDDEGFGRAKRPVINVSWTHIQAYLSWLNAKTGKTYRLPNAVEWEYAARAGTSSRFHTGDCLTTRQANINGKIDFYCKGKAGESTNPAVHRKQTLPVGSFPPNAWGLYDMHGNVSEVLADCPVYARKDAEGNCHEHSYRGGDWWTHSDRARAHFRSSIQSFQFNKLNGFRLVQVP